MTIFKMIRNFFMGLLAIGFMLALLMIGGYADTHYSTTAQVFSVEEDGTTFVDGAGYLWGVYDTDYVRGEFVKIYFDNNTTDYTRNDDIIIKVKRLDN